MLYIFIPLKMETVKVSFDLIFLAAIVHTGDFQRAMLRLFVLLLVPCLVFGRPPVEG